MSCPAPHMVGDCRLPMVRAVSMWKGIIKLEARAMDRPISFMSLSSSVAFKVSWSNALTLSLVFLMMLCLPSAYVRLQFTDFAKGWLQWGPCYGYGGQ